MIRIVALSVAVLLGGCASVDAPASQRGSATDGLSPQDVSAGFGVAVVDGCAAAAEAGKTLAELASDRIVPETSGEQLITPKPGSTMWAPIPGKGIVTIEEEAGGAKCNVSAYGPPVESTFNAIVSALGARGYRSEPMPPAGARFYHHDLKLVANGRTVRVALVGNEPGAAGMRSRFSVISAYVSVTTP